MTVGYIITVLLVPVSSRLEREGEGIGRSPNSAIGATKTKHPPTGSPSFLEDCVKSPQEPMRENQTVDRLGIFTVNSSEEVLGVKGFF